MFHAGALKCIAAVTISSSLFSQREAINKMSTKKREGERENERKIEKKKREIGDVYEFFGFL